MNIFDASDKAKEEDAVDLKPIIERAREEVLEVKARDGMPGVALALVDGEQVAWCECFGTVRADGGASIDADTIFSLQSTSKTFTATAVMLAVQQGLLDLDAPITAYLPDFRVHSRFEPDPEARITLRRLLSHHAGFTHEAPVGGNFGSALDAETPTFEQHVASIPDTWLRWPVGQRYGYSNLGIDLAGAALAKACGARFSECLKALIFDPLGMTRSTADPDVYAAEPNRAIGHQPGFASVPVRIPIEASGGVYSSVTDMVRYARFHMGKGSIGGKIILEPALWEEMHTPPVDGIPYALGILRLPLLLERASPVLYNHDGGGFGFGCCFTHCPEHELAWIALFNGATRLGPPAPFDRLGLLEALHAEFGGPAKPEGPEKEIPPARDRVAPYVGTYVAGQAGMTMGWEGEAFGFRLPGDQAPNPLSFVDPERAVIAEGPRAGRRVRLHPATDKQTPWVQFEAGDVASYFAFMYGAIYSLNDGEAAPPQAVGDAYDHLLGDYQVVQWGVPLINAPLAKRDGALWLGSWRLVEDGPGLFFSADGELLDLTGSEPVFRNIPLRRVQAA